MRATFRNLLETKRREREETTGDAGFSLIELIIVIVIIGILVAIALPLFGFIQKTAVDGATQSATKNAATTATADWANDPTTAAAQSSTDATAIATKTSSSLTITVTGTSASNVCATGYDTKGQKYTAAGAATSFSSGPGCP